MASISDFGKKIAKVGGQERKFMAIISDFGKKSAKVRWGSCPPPAPLVRNALKLYTFSCKLFKILARNFKTFIAFTELL